MKRKQMRSFTVSINRTSFKRLIVMTIIGMMALFIFTGMLTSFEPGYGLASNQVHEWATGVKGEDFVHVLGMENKFFTQVLPEDSRPPSLSNLAFEVATSINPDDPRSLLGRELPGFALFDGQIIVAGDGMDYTTLPIESSPPMDVIMAEREATQESLARLEELKKEAVQSQGTTDGRKVVHIIHSHNTESFLPELETNKPNEAFHKKINITLVGEKLSQELEKRGIGVEVEERDVQAGLVNKGWQYSQSYDASRNYVKEAIANNDDLKFFFDLHRDTLPKERTTVKINGVEYARTVFVIGGRHSHHEQNLQLAKQLHNLLEEKYPGLSRGVILKDTPGSNGIYNQDLSPNSVLIEMGGLYNTLDETYKTTGAIAEVFSEYYFEAEAVDAE
ncbi:stage II sporulation protein P [Alkalihalobacillus deserti]|uniref:stage II sporulation protein P n=1 Tax=Alkalihalobacillus deserti TaxID=2879466 RepID=UPI001D134186|nr:stage II sporulation protein P [Alkalihalobacillus deserti]